MGAADGCGGGQLVSAGDRTARSAATHTIGGLARGGVWCDPIDQSGKLAGLGCRYAAELELSAEAGGVRFLQFILAMPDAATATTAAAEIDDTDLKARPGSRIENYATGKWKAGAQDQFVVITMVTATAAVDTALVNKYLGYRHADILGAIAFR
ncbi:hypothetical protein [Nocardia asteroides]|uniref:hypothetical protein n=1 Tax=Nocardia asteroides TaxID=1824 RepID=UPI000F83603C|nr:hypothetical protein [Nocardia asteroides]UGT48302.1 hypothetical protein LT345_28140 [Nocardia asteroides]